MSFGSSERGNRCRTTLGVSTERVEKYLKSPCAVSIYAEQNVPLHITDTEVKRVEEDNYMFPASVGDTKPLERTENDISYMITRQLQAGKRFPKAYMATGVVP